jgi:predicted SAM-dependent methyltransferase
MKRILNLGCGKSRYGTDFADISPSRKDVKNVDLDSDRFPYQSSTFDEVFSENLFEHLTDPGRFLRECFRVLKKDGKLIIITDNANYYGWAIKKTHLGGYEKVEEAKGFQDDRHYSVFTDWHLKNHFKKVGFRKTSVEYLPSNIITVPGFFGFLLNKALDLTPLFRMGHSKLKVIGTK